MNKSEEKLGHAPLKLAEEVGVVALVTGDAEELVEVDVELGEGVEALFPFLNFVSVSVSSVFRLLLLLLLRPALVLLATAAAAAAAAAVVKL